MRYSDLLVRLSRLKSPIEQVGRVTVGRDSAVYLGRSREIVIPFQFECHTFYAPSNQDDFWLDPEEIAALLRRFKVTMDEFTATAHRVPVHLKNPRKTV
jgi:hypothetical protein